MFTLNRRHGVNDGITVSFQPVFTGIRNGTLNVGDSGGGSPQMVTLNGAGSN